jgi:hypothetical protein
MAAVAVAPPPPAPITLAPPQFIDLGVEDPDELTDPTPVPIAPTPSARLRAERSSSSNLTRLHGILSPQDEAEIDIPTFLRRQGPPNHE